MTFPTAASTESNTASNRKINELEEQCTKRDPQKLNMPVGTTRLGKLLYPGKAKTLKQPWNSTCSVPPRGALSVSGTYAHGHPDNARTIMTGNVPNPCALSVPRTPEPSSSSPPGEPRPPRPPRS
jgi:hypothetical protein